MWQTQTIVYNKVTVSLNGSQITSCPVTYTITQNNAERTATSIYTISTHSST